MNKIFRIAEPFPSPKMQYGVSRVRFFQAGLHIYRYSSIEEFGQVMPHLHDVFSTKMREHFLYMLWSGIDDGIPYAGRMVPW